MSIVNYHQYQPHLDRPVFDSEFKFVDGDCKIIADFLFSETNTTFRQAFPTGIIKTYRSFNDIVIPIVDYPCLKVYKTDEELFTPLSSPSSTGFSIAYILAFSAKQPLSDVSVFVGRELVRNIINAGFLPEPLFQLDTDNALTVEYDTFIDPQNRVFKYVTINCRIYTNYV